MYNRLTIFQGEGQPAIPSFNWNPEDSPERFFDEPLGVNVDTLKLISNSAVPCLSGWVSAAPAHSAGLLLPLTRLAGLLLLPAPSVELLTFPAL